jgi:hypothetical protein
MANGGPEGGAPAPVDAPPVTTHSVAEVRDLVRGRAGALPRSAWDQAYIDLQTGWRVSKYEPLRITP